MGVPVIINASFNLRDEPITCSSIDAIRTFFRAGMDALVIGTFGAEK
jgi:carbamoyltransferase